MSFRRANTFLRSELVQQQVYLDNARIQANVAVSQRDLAGQEISNATAEQRARLESELLEHHRFYVRVISEEYDAGQRVVNLTSENRLSAQHRPRCGGEPSP